VLAESKGDAVGMLGLAHDLEVKLPGTRAAFLDGILSEEKAAIIARATAVLTTEEAGAAEALVLDRAARLTPAGLRSAIARAVIEVAPEKAKDRRGAGRPRGPGGTLGRGVRQRRPGRPGAARRPGARGRSADQLLGPAAQAGRPGRIHG
jgi:Domain of unknown function (DUF222)